MLRKRLTLLATLVLGVAVMTSSAAAQEVGTIQATATVVTTLSISGTQDLRFGVVTPGVNKSVDKATVGEAGEWQISGTVGAEISLNFTLPDSLQHQVQAIGMTVAFSAIDASFDDGTGSQILPAGILNPNAAGAERLGAAGDMTVWIGGTVYPNVGQAGGNYASDVVLTVAYTGS